MGVNNHYYCYSRCTASKANWLAGLAALCRCQETNYSETRRIDGTSILHFVPGHPEFKASLDKFNGLDWSAWLPKLILFLKPGISLSLF